jgi:hypothetical protein
LSICKMNLPLALELNWAAPVVDANPAGGTPESAEGLIFAALAQGVFASMADPCATTVPREIAPVEEETDDAGSEEAVPAEAAALLAWFPAPVAPLSWAAKELPGVDNSMPAAIAAQLVTQPNETGAPVKTRITALAIAAPSARNEATAAERALPSNKVAADGQEVPQAPISSNSLMDAPVAPDASISLQVQVPAQSVSVPGPANRLDFPMRDQRGAAPPDSASSMAAPNTAAPVDNALPQEGAAPLDSLRLAFRKSALPARQSEPQNRVVDQDGFPRFESANPVEPAINAAVDATTEDMNVPVMPEWAAEQSPENGLRQSAEPQESSVAAPAAGSEKEQPASTAAVAIPVEKQEGKSQETSAPSGDSIRVPVFASPAEANRPWRTTAPPAASAPPPEPALEPSPLWRRPVDVGQPQVIAIRIPLEGQHKNASGAQQVSLQFSQRMGRLDLAIQAPTAAVRQQLEESLSHLMANLKTEGWIASGNETARLAERMTPAVPAEPAMRVLDHTRVSLTSAVASPEIRGSQPERQQWAGGFSQDRSDTHTSGHADPQGGRRRSHRRSGLWAATIEQQEQQ